MSRIGIKPIPVPKGVTVTKEGDCLTVKGPKGVLSRTFHPEMVIKIGSDRIVVERPSDHRLHRSLHGLTRTLIANMVHGVTEGYEKTLEISGMGYRAQKQGDKVILNLGFIKPVEIVPPEGIEITVNSPTSITVKGIDKEKVGQVAAEIRALRKPEPYRGSGVKYAGEQIRRKVAKATK
ncbi:MAG TPA: 50S ribosomal protein L6 [Firmicutes bacterium]|nr:50S ribosomal protein L6 [Candidatus Fermentithermobacillaceae bacterium]